MVLSTLSFSQFASAGNLTTNSEVVGLSAGTNASFTNPWAFLPPGNTASRPTPSASIYYLLRFNTDSILYEFYNPLTTSWISLAQSQQFVWNSAPSSQAMMANNGYITTSSSGLVSLSLPSVSVVGQPLSVAGMGSSGWEITQGTGQIVHVGSSPTTSGTGGSISSSNQYDSINLLCIVANTTWTTVGKPQGTLTIV